MSINRIDYLKHYIAGYLIASASDIDYEHWYVSQIFATAAGIGKEVYDKASKKGNADIVDALCTIAGGLTYLAQKVIKIQIFGL